MKLQPENDSIGEVLATREMSYASPEGVISTVSVHIGRPYQEPLQTEGADQRWFVPVQTRGLGDDQHNTIYGVDAVQAIYLALAFAGAQVARSPLASKLDWAAVPHFGFPAVPGVTGNGLA